jgi:hypothetical protein
VTRPNPIRLIDRWRGFARRRGLGCTECGRRFHLKSELCRAHLLEAYVRAMHEVAAEEVRRGRT